MGESFKVQALKERVETQRSCRRNVTWELGPLQSFKKTKPNKKEKNNFPRHQSTDVYINLPCQQRPAQDIQCHLKHFF